MPFNFRSTIPGMYLVPSPTHEAAEMELYQLSRKNLSSLIFGYKEILYNVTRIRTKLIGPIMDTRSHRHR